jgi:hypothetical protein
MMRSKKKNYWFMSNAHFREMDLYSKSERRVRKTASRLVFTGMLFMFPELFIVCSDFPVPWASFWALLFLIGGLMNMGGYACLLFGWHISFEFIKSIKSIKRFISRSITGIGGGVYDRRKTQYK